MMTGFLVEFRMHGYARSYANEIIHSVAKRFGVRGVTGKRVVPHISLYGPGATDDIREVVSAVERIGSRYSLVPFKVKGFGFFDKGPKTIFLDISPSQELEDLRWDLSRELAKVSTCQPWDGSRNHAFHATIAFKDVDSNFDQIWSYVKSREEPDISQYLLRITVLSARRRIICEYDLVLRKLLSRTEALSKYWWRRTIDRLRELQGLPPERHVT